MKIGIPREVSSSERRVALLPENVTTLMKLDGVTTAIESGLGEHLGFDDTAYRDAGAEITSDRNNLFSSSDIIFRIHKPLPEEVALLKGGAASVSFFDPFKEEALVDAFVRQKTSALSMEMIPRITRAQKMDALSSQASLAGYAAVIYGASILNKIFPMMMTPAGTISPSRVFVIGAGVAGLQAVATAKRLGARVEAFDTRPAVEEQVKSLGAKFVKVDLGETVETKQGYAGALSSEQLKKQQEVMAGRCADSDLVITTAKVFGRPAPRIITGDMIKKMSPGSVVIDMAVESGGNVEGSEPGEVIEINGVTIAGIGNFESRVAVHASQVYGNNLTAFFKEFYREEDKGIDFNADDEILQGALITRGGEIVHEAVRKARGK